jgi:hypothetical protein
VHYPVKTGECAICDQRRAHSLCAGTARSACPHRRSIVSTDGQSAFANGLVICEQTAPMTPTQKGLTHLYAAFADMATDGDVWNNSPSLRLARFAF